MIRLMRKLLIFCVALMMSVVAHGDEMNWNFSSQRVTIDGNSYYLDGTNKVAQFYTYYSQFDSLMVIPATVSYDGVTYTVRSMKGEYNLPEAAKGVKAIQLPNTMQELGDYAFNGFRNLYEVKVNTVTPPVLKSNFRTDNLYVRVLLPKGTIHDYRIADTRWNNVILVDGSGIEVSVNLTTAGTLSNEIVKKAAYLQDVNVLKVSGEINGEDLNIIKINMPNLISIDLSEAKLAVIPDSWLQDRWGVEKIVLPKVIEKIGESAFIRCYHLNEINFPTSLKNISVSAFWQCNALKEVNLNEGLTELGSYAFYGCTQLRKVSLPSTLVNTNQNTFADCGMLEDVHFSEGLQVIAYGMFRQCGLKDITLPYSLRTISEEAFRGNPLENVIINEGLETLSTRCFSNCKSLKKITLPSTLRYMYYEPFNSATALKDIYIRAGIPPYVNGRCPLSAVNMNDVVLHVPAMSQSIYKSTPGWSDFYTIEEMNNYRPTSFATSEERIIDIDDDLTNSNYKPVMTTFRSDWDNKFSYGSFTVNGSGAVNLSKYSACYDYKRLYEQDNKDRFMTSIVNNVPMTADSISTILYTYDNSWAFVSFPYDVKVKDIKPVLEGITNFAIREYSGENRAMGDMNYTWVKLNSESTLSAYKGYIISTERRMDYNQYNSALEIPSSKTCTIANKDVSIPLNAYPSEFTQNQGWNLVGNPYQCYYDTRYMDFTSPITVWNMRNRTYEAYNPKDDSYIFSPGEAFFVQCSGANQSITFSTEGRQTSRQVRAASNAKAMGESGNNRRIINLSLSDGKQTDRTRVVINEAASDAYELDKDASKFISTEAAQIYTVNGGVQYAINECPMGNGVMAVGTYFNADGEYSISLADDIDTGVALIDTQEGKSISLNDGKLYAFTAKAGYSQRFKLKVGEATSISEITAEEKDTDWYNAAGQRVNANAKGLKISRNGKKIVLK